MSLDLGSFILPRKVLHPRISFAFYLIVLFKGKLAGGV
jgi:hypothetical protein